MKIHEAILLLPQEVRAQYHGAYRNIQRRIDILSEWRMTDKGLSRAARHALSMELGWLRKDIAGVPRQSPAQKEVLFLGQLGFNLGGAKSNLAQSERFMCNNRGMAAEIDTAATTRLMGAIREAQVAVDNAHWFLKKMYAARAAQQATREKEKENVN